MTDFTETEYAELQARIQISLDSNLSALEDELKNLREDLADNLTPIMEVANRVDYIIITYWKNLEEEQKAMLGSLRVQLDNLLDVLEEV